LVGFAAVVGSAENLGGSVGALAGLVEALAGFAEALVGFVEAVGSVEALAGFADVMVGFVAAAGSAAALGYAAVCLFGSTVYAAAVDGFVPMVDSVLFLAVFVAVVLEVPWMLWVPPFGHVAAAKLTSTAELLAQSVKVLLNDRSWL
jgi:hypothetical protein